MKFEVGKWYYHEVFKKNKYLCVYIIDDGTGILSVYCKDSGRFKYANNYPPSSAESFKEIKEPRELETKSTWYAAVNFCIPPEDNIGRVFGVKKCWFEDNINKARNYLDERYPSLAKVEITAKVTEVFEDE